MAGLTEGGQCEGLAFRIPAAIVEQETDIMWMREMIFEGYTPTFVPLQTPQGPLEGLALLADTRCRGLVDLDEEATARLIATGIGILGSNLEYLDNLHEHLLLLGIDDPGIRQLHVRTLRIAADVRGATE